MSSSSSEDQYDFDDELYAAFMSRLVRDFGITDRDELDGGLSGARTFSVRIDGSAQVKMGQYILKVSLSEKAEQEVQMHRAAKGSRILRRYIPDLITFQKYPDMPLAAILYQVAGGGH